LPFGQWAFSPDFACPPIHVASRNVPSVQ
jgi:hypothetical protein